MGGAGGVSCAAGCAFAGVGAAAAEMAGGDGTRSVEPEEERATTWVRSDAPRPTVRTSRRGIAATAGTAGGGGRSPAVRRGGRDGCAGRRRLGGGTQGAVVGGGAVWRAGDGGARHERGGGVGCGGGRRGRRVSVGGGRAPAAAGDAATVGMQESPRAAAGRAALRLR